MAMRVAGRLFGTPTFWRGSCCVLFPYRVKNDTSRTFRLELLAAAVVLVDRKLVVHYMNPSAENLFELNFKNAAGLALGELFDDTEVLSAAVNYARDHNCSYTEHASNWASPAGNFICHAP